MGNGLPVINHVNYFTWETLLYIETMDYLILKIGFQNVSDEFI